MDHQETFSFIQEIAANLSSGPVVFPTAFDTTLRIRDLLRADDASALDIAKVIQADPLLASRVLQTANSAALNRTGSPIRDVRAAVTLIGLNQVRMLALAIATQQLRTYREMVRFERLSTQYMQHSRLVAAICHVLARDYTRIPPDTAYFAGLVHDIGIFYLLYRIAEHMSFFPDPEEIHGLLFDWHGSIGHALFSALDMPQEITDAIENHDEPRPVPKLSSLGDLLYVCNRIVATVGPEPARIAPPHGKEDEELITQWPQLITSVEAAQAEIDQLTRLI